MKKIIKFMVILVVLSGIIGVVLQLASGESIFVTGNESNSKNGSIFTDITGENEKVALDILKQCGINKVKSAEFDETLGLEDEVGYRVSTEHDTGAKVIVYFVNGSISNVRAVDQYLYNEGEVVQDINNLYLSFDEQSDYNIQCMKLVKGILKSPSTAKFPSVTDWSIFLDTDGKVIVQSYVDSQNNFGAMIRSDFQFIINNSTIESFIFEGQELIN